MPETIHIRELLTAEEYAEYEHKTLMALTLAEKHQQLTADIAAGCPPKSLRQAADRLGVSKEFVRQTEKTVLHNLQGNPVIQELRKQY